MYGTLWTALFSYFQHRRYLCLVILCIGYLFVCFRPPGAGIAVIAVVCIGFLVFLIILGIARIRSAQRRSVEVSMDDKQEMEWDNSALNITVNPMDREVGWQSAIAPCLPPSLPPTFQLPPHLSSFPLVSLTCLKYPLNHLDKCFSPQRNTFQYCILRNTEEDRIFSCFLFKQF